MVPAAKLRPDIKANVKRWPATGIQFGWAEAAMITNSGLPKEMDCGYGCKVYAKQTGCVIRYAVFHSRVYGCPA